MNPSELRNYARCAIQLVFFCKAHNLVMAPDCGTAVARCCFTSERQSAHGLGRLWTTDLGGARLPNNIRENDEDADLAALPEDGPQSRRAEGVSGDI